LNAVNAAIVVAIISAAAGLLASALTFSLTKKKEREAEWRKQKLEHYKEMMAALNGVVGSPLSTDAKIRFANAANNIFLVGAPTVLVALRAFLDETATSNKNRSSDECHDRLLTELMFAIRDDLGIEPNKPISGYTFRLWSGQPRE
jgi:hypothetical protein